MVSQENLLEIHKLCLLNPDREVCGLVAGGKVYQLENVSKNPSNCFVFSKREYFKLLQQLTLEKLEVECVWHTHPNGTAKPSKADLEFVKYGKRDSLIVSKREYEWLEHA